MKIEQLSNVQLIFKCAVMSSKWRHIPVNEFILSFIKTLMFDYNMLIRPYSYNLDRVDNLLALETHIVI
jgi:K+-sensing histidine kinase KdpD